ncbi:MAG: tetratricopeptide (TPR) repeat protein [Bacteroidia bacterium]|jgi:tetratricopeptide (TPR) repeat protein
MDEEDFSDLDLSELIRRFEADNRSGNFGYYDGDDLLDIVEYFLDRIDYKKAMQVCDLAIGQHPYNGAFLSKKAHVLTFLDQLTEAENVLQVALDLEPNNPEYMMQLSGILELTGKPIEALGFLEQAIDFGAPKEDVLVAKMFVYYNIGNFTMALQMIESIYSEVIEEDRLILETHFCIQLMECYSDGIRIFEAYTNLDPYNEIVWQHLGQLQMCIGLHEDALNSFDLSLAIDEDYADAHIERAHSLMELENYSEAAKSFERFVDLEGESSLVLCLLADCFRLMGMNTRARLTYRRALKENPKSLEAWHGLGKVSMLEQKHAEALELLTKAHKIDQTDEDVIFDLMQSEVNLEMYEMALERLNLLTNLAPHSVGIWLVMATIHHEQYEDTSKAIEILHEALALNDGNAELTYKLAAYYFCSGESDFAYNLLQAALMTDFDSHYLIYEDAPFLNRVRAVQDIIDLYKKK